MAGIYIHIPFCKKKCYYCDFFSATSLKQIPALTDALCNEMQLRKEYTGGERIETVYFGGGTPSLLSPGEINKILTHISTLFLLDPDAEITLEANPDDLDFEYLSGLKSIGINRLSIGIQSFSDPHLKLLNRRHSAQQAIECIDISHKAGFQNITGDLMYGLPWMSSEQWQQNLEQFFELEIPHLSAYHLGIEPKTVLAQQLKKGIIKQIDEDLSVKEYQLLMEKACRHGYLHYEISNFAKPGFIARHNSNYWKNKKYLGIGPSAHSYDLESRQWNVSHTGKYIEAIQKGLVPSTVENLSRSDKLNEYIMTSLRTMWGLNLEQAEIDFGESTAARLRKRATVHLKSQRLELKNNHLILTNTGKFISDFIISDLLCDE